jgi:bisanhydrobacterioruberin hydratase
VQRYSKYTIATAIAILFHTVGLVGILFFNRDAMVALTPVNLLLSAALLWWTQAEKNKAFYLFVIACIIIGYLVEVIGVNTGYLFGHYRYETALGIKLFNVPPLIGINWFMIIYCCGISMQQLLQKPIFRDATSAGVISKRWQAYSIIFDGASLAVLFDWIIEPMAVKLGYWTWLGEDANIPLYNYLCWLLVSMLLLWIFHRFQFVKQNKFAIHLLLIQAMFFLILRTLLK